MGFLSELGELFTGGLGTAVGGLLGFLGQEDTNKSNRALGREQMAFQERMSSTAYQRAVADMKSAGLNPMLAYSQGGASSPVGSMPQVQNSVASGVASAAQSLQMMQAAQQVKQTEASTNLLAAQAAEVRSRTFDASLNTAYRQAEVKELQERAARVGFEKLTAEEQVRLIRWNVAERQREFDARESVDYWTKVAKGEVDRSSLYGLEIPKAKAEADFYRTIGPGNKYLEMIFDAVSGASSAKDLLKGLPRGYHGRAK